MVKSKLKTLLMLILLFITGGFTGYWTERKIVEKSEEALIIMLLECEAAQQGINL